MWVQFSHNKFHTVTSLLLDDDDGDDNTRLRGGGCCVIHLEVVLWLVATDSWELRNWAHVDCRNIYQRQRARTGWTTTIQCSAVQPGLVISHRYRLHRRIGAKRSFSGTSRILGTVIKVVVLALSSTCGCCWEGMVDRRVRSA